MSYELLNNVKVPSSILPLVEYSDEIYILGLKHAKDGLTPYGKKYLYMAGPQDQIYTKESCYLTALGAGWDNDVPVSFGEGYGEGIFGSIYRKDSDTTYRYETKGYSVNVVNGVAVRNVNPTYAPIQTIYKSTSYDLITARSGTANVIGLYLVPTTDSTAATALYATTYTSYAYLDEDTSYVYIIAYKENGKVNIVKFDKSAKTCTLITTVNSLNMETGPKASFYTKNMCYRTYKSGTITYIPVIYLNASNAVVVRMITYDKSIAGSDISLKMTYSDYTLTGTITTPVTAVSGYEYFFRNDGVLCICHRIWGVATAIGTATLDMFGVYTLELDHVAKTATVQGFVQAANSVPVHYMFEGDVIYPITTSSYAKLEYDSVNKKYVKTGEIPTAHYSIGKDSRGYIYYVDNNYKLQCATPGMVRMVEVYTDNSEVKSNTYPVDKICKVVARSSTGERLAKPVTLVISSGPGVWSNGLKTIEVQSSATEDVAVTLTITGQGDTVIHPKVSGAIS